MSACAACQNCPWISWTEWTEYCPPNITAAEGTYPGTIPPDTVVPRWAYVQPNNTDDFFNVTIAEQIGGKQYLNTFDTETALTFRCRFPGKFPGSEHHNQLVKFIFRQLHRDPHKQCIFVHLHVHRHLARYISHHSKQSWRRW